MLVSGLQVGCKSHTRAAKSLARIPKGYYHNSKSAYIQERGASKHNKCTFLDLRPESVFSQKYNFPRAKNVGAVGGRNMYFFLIAVLGEIQKQLETGIFLFLQAPRSCQHFCCEGSR